MVQIILTIPNDKLEEFKAGFLKVNPIPLDKDGNPRYTELEWFKHWIKVKLMRDYQVGKRRIWDETNQPVFDPNVIQ